MPKARQLAGDLKQPGQMRTFENGARIEALKGGYYRTWDAKGNACGMTKSLAEAEYMAEHGYVNCIDEACDLDLWPMWNACVDAKVTVFQADDGWQYLLLGHGTMMAAIHNPNSGYEVRFLTESTFRALYQSTDYPDVIELPLAAEPLKLA